MKKEVNSKIIKEKVSIVIPTYNHGKYIRKCIESIISQTYNNWEAIIVNNNSTDNTVDIINNFNEERISIINIDIECECENGVPEPTDAEERVNAITLKLFGHDETHVIGIDNFDYKTDNPNIVYHKTRHTLDFISFQLFMWKGL